LDAEKCLMLDKDAVIASANEAGIAIIAEENQWVNHRS
jgi:DUF1009 family protein